MGITVVLGNPAPKEWYVDGDGKKVFRVLDGPPRETMVGVPGSDNLAAAFVTITNPKGGVWGVQSAAEKPLCVKATSPALEMLLAEHWGIPVGTLSSLNLVEVSDEN